MVLWEELHSVGCSDASGFWHVNFVVPVMVQSRFTVKALFAMAFPCSSIFGAFVDDALASRGC